MQQLIHGVREYSFVLNMEHNAIILFDAADVFEVEISVSTDTTMDPGVCVVNNTEQVHKQEHYVLVQKYYLD